MIFDGVKVGDKVWSLLYGEGLVTRTTVDVNYPLEVCSVLSGGIDYYTLDGHYECDRDDSLQVLFWSEPTVTVPPRKVERWVAAFEYLPEKETRLVGAGMTPTYFLTKEEAESATTHFPICWVAPVMIPEGLL